jgi:hypothetical protein
MSIDNPNAWAVMFRKPPDIEWSIQVWYPSITVTHINGNALSEESQFDIGEARASQEATRMNNVWRSEYEVAIDYVYHAPFDKLNGDKATYTGVYGDV